MSLEDPRVVEQEPYGDTEYYLIAAERLPLLIPLQRIGVPEPILAVVDAPLRVLVEASYVRDVSPGEHVQFSLLPSTGPITLGVNVVRAIPVGIDDGLEEAGFERALGTTPPDHPYGVGGDDQGGVFGDSPLATETTRAPTGAQWAADVSSDDSSKVTDKQPTDGEQSPLPATNPGTRPGDADAPDVVRPRPRGKVVRGPIEFDRPKLPVDRPSGDGPLQRIVKGFTGPRSDPTAGAKQATGDDTDESPGGNDAA